jgi:hypothetical protein
MIRVEKVDAPKEEQKVSASKREIRIEISEGIELSEEEMNRVVAATQNEIVDIIRGVKAKDFVARPKNQVV